MTGRDRLPWPLVFQVLGVAAAVWLLVRTWPLWLMAFTALIVAAAILPAARLGERYRIRRGATVAVVYLLVAGVFAAMGRLVWPALTEQGRQFTDQLPRLFENLQRWFGSVDTWLGGWGASLPVPKPENIQALVGTLLANTFAVTAGVVGFVVGLFAVLVIAAYVVIDAEDIGSAALELVPRAYHARVTAAALPVLDRVGAYVRGQLLSSLIVGALLATGMAILGVRYALLIGALAAVLNVVPFVGSIAAAVLGILSALNESIGLAVATAALFSATSLFEGKVLAPHFIGRATGLHPLVVLLALFAGAHLAGLIGAVVAVPFVAGASEAARRLRPPSARG